MSSLPIIFYHHSIDEFGYLFFTLCQARKTNPSSRIILLFDQFTSGGVVPLNILAKEHGMEPIKTDNYQQGVSDFVGIYSHMSTNDYNFEMACFVRWFTIRNFVKEQKIDKFFYTDSDVLLFGDVGKEREKTFSNFRMTLTNNVSAGISFINDVSVLDEYCNLCMKIFLREDKFNYDKCYSHFMCLQQNNRAGGVNDMTVWNIFRKDAFNNPGLVGETSVITSDLATFDHNVNQSDSFDMDPINNIKQFIWRDGQPYCRSRYIDKLIRFNCIHFQGGAKRFIEGFYNHA